jgi:hypothetical protein
LEGRVAGAFNTTDRNPGQVGAIGGIKLEPIRAQVTGSGNVEPFPDNTTYIYTGQMFFPDNTGTGQSQFNMAECFDDSTQIKIDGVQRLNNTVWNVANDTGVLSLPAGWHDVEFRFGEGGGGWGPSGQDGWNNTFGFGVDFTQPIDPATPEDTPVVKPIQSEYTRPVDPGNATVFRFVSPNFGQVQVDSGATLKVGAVVGTNVVNIAAGATLQLNGVNTSKIKASALTIAGTPTAPTGTLDVGDSAIVLDYDGASPAGDIRSQIIAGRAATGGGTSTWTGKGITSSKAASDVLGAPESTAVGYAVNGALPLGSYSTFRGQAVDATTVLIRYTRGADANLDGKVDDNDVTIVGSNYAPGAARPADSAWALGDFNYDGFVDDNDVTLLGVLYNPSAPALPAPDGGGVAAVPEPASWLMYSPARPGVTWRSSSPRSSHQARKRPAMRP